MNRSKFFLAFLARISGYKRPREARNFGYVSFGHDSTMLRAINVLTRYIDYKNLKGGDKNLAYTVFPPIRPAGLIFSYFGNAGTISEQGSISMVTIS